MNLFRKVEPGEFLSSQAFCLVGGEIKPFPQPGEPYAPEKHGIILMEANGPHRKEIWRLGQIVYLRSGSPPLTISSEAAPSGSYCEVAWFDGSQCQHALFESNSLTDIRPEQILQQ